MSRAIPSQERLAGWLRLFGVAGLVVLADQISKAIVEHDLVLGERSELIPGVHVTRILNEGVAFGFLGGRGVGGVLVITAIALVLVLGWFASGPRSAGISIAVGLVVGGAVGNLIDRIRQDAVTDFISLPLWPTFNIADVAITFGVVGLVLGALFTAERK